MGYYVDVEKFTYAIEDISKTHELFNKALSKGWKPEFEKAIETWHTACLELEIGEGYVEHILEEHEEDDIIFRMESVLVAQAEEFLAMEQEFVVAFVETDGDSFDGVHAKVMTGETPESVARARVAEAAKFYKSEHEKCSDGLEWKETLPSQLENEEQIKDIISGWHSYYQVFVFSLSGEQFDIDLVGFSKK